jgi:hypothetical protein
MKRFTLAFLLMAGTVFAGRAGTDVVLHINHLLDGEPFAFKQAVAADGYSWDVIRMEYYVSGIEVLHDGGNVTAVEDTWLLVNAGEEARYALGNLDVTVVEGIRFRIGVEEAYNHLDPATWPADHPLAYQFPSMHWGWASGYRFVCMEGEAEGNTWQIHALGDANYHTVQIDGAAVDEGGTLVFYANGDYARALDGVDLSAGLIEHSETGLAADFLLDFSTDVFTRGTEPIVASALGSAPQGPGLSLLGNPASDGTTTVAWSGLSAEGATLTVRDAAGRLLRTHTVATPEGRLPLRGLSAGTHFVTLQAGGRARTLRLLVP